MFDKAWNQIVSVAEKAAERHDVLLPDEMVTVSGEPQERHEKRLAALAVFLDQLLQAKPVSRRKRPAEK